MGARVLTLQPGETLGVDRGDIVVYKDNKIIARFSDDPIIIGNGGIDLVKSVRALSDIT